MPTRWITRTFAALALAGALSGCIYQPAPAYSAYPGYEAYPAYPAYPTYYPPAYAYPAPAYAPAPFFGSLNLGFGDWGGHRHRHWR
jgi:hypothetical protein